MNGLTYILFLFFLSLKCVVFSTPIPSFHPPTTQELTISSEAPYIILHDYGQISFEVVKNELLVRYDYYKRIKVFESQAFPQTEWEIMYGGEGKQEKLIGFEGYTYSVNGDKFIQTNIELSEERRNQESLKKQNSLTIENLASGDIFEYSYTIYSDEFFELKSWDFQKYVPVVKSEYHTYIPEDYEYLATFQGNIDQLNQEKSTYEGKVFRLKGEQLNLPVHWLQSRMGIEAQHRLNLSGTLTSLTIEHVAPIIPEPYMSSIDDFRIKFKQQLMQVNLSMTGAYQMVGSWKDMNDRLLKHIHFGKRLKIQGSLKDQLRDIAKATVKEHKKERDRVNDVFNYLREEMSWNRDYSIFASSLNQAWEKKLGNSSEINLLLVALLRSADISAFPVLISTREHGHINPAYPIVSQFNHVIVAVQLRGGFILLDALSDVVEVGMLPRNDLNGFGFLVDQRQSGIIELSPSYALMRNTYGEFSIDFLQKKLLGDIDITHRAYSAALERARLNYELSPTQTYLKTILSNSSEVEISHLDIQQLEKRHEPLKVAYRAQVAEHVKMLNDLLVISPFSTDFFEKNPFQNKERKYPVDFSCPIQDNQTFVLKIPEGHELIQVPQNAILALPDGGGTFIFDVVQITNSIRVSSSLQINQTVFSTEEYPNLQSFFNFMIHKLDEDIILRKIQTQD